jgi:hypothetical protein
METKEKTFEEISMKEEPEIESWKYATDKDGNLLDERGNKTLSPDMAYKIWRPTELPKPIGKKTLYLVTLKTGNVDPQERVQQITILGRNFPRTHFKVSEEDPRRPDKVYPQHKFAQNQYDAIMDRAKFEPVRIPQRKDENGEPLKGANGRPLDPPRGRWVYAIELLDLIPYYGKGEKVVGAGAMGGLEAMKLIERLEKENAQLRGELPEVSPEEQLREMLYASNLLDPDDPRPVSKALLELSEQLESTKRDYPENKKGKPKGK